MKLSSVLTITGVSLGVAVLGYAVYFDYRRRNDPSFRKLLKKQTKRSAKAAKREKKAAVEEENAALDALVREIASPGVLPADVQQRESFFMEQVAMGEALFAQGPAYHVQAAGAFFKALKVYPAPLELVMIYQKAVPKEVFDLIMKLVARDVRPPVFADQANANASSNAASSAALDGVDDESPMESATIQDIDDDAKEDVAKEDAKTEEPKKATEEPKEPKAEAEAETEAEKPKKEATEEAA
ncbi:mitochondrial import receptor subunit tom20 [Malassezia cuniculi]|uniref:Mitochondrial import receptor subunit tom20 n=1 Tax=Malassezia cuniculi TaxID=948313 RepID=A0AAF0EWW1_9BASI|nr:mitochondrial import receptor subunit tom20 [Malassezia cuniculi]